MSKRHRMDRKVLCLVVAMLMMNIGDAKKPCYSAIYSFGDSLTDTGNLLLSEPNLAARSGRLPYGQTFFHRPSGRFSDGRLVVDFIAKESGMPMLNPYLNLSADFSWGVNFAVAGATALNSSYFFRRKVSPRAVPSTLDMQIEWFFSYRKSFCRNYTGDCNEHFNKAFFLMGEIGGNDYNYAFYQNRGMNDVEKLIEPVVSKIIKSVRRLIRAGGARKIMVQNNLPIGCAPVYLSTFPEEPRDETGCMPRFNDFARKGNALLFTKLAYLRSEHGEANIVLANYYLAALKVLLLPQPFGFEKDEVLRACCGYGGEYNFQGDNTCGTLNARSCEDPAKYFSWDGVHNTDAANGMMAHLFMHENLTSPPLPTLCDI